MNRTLKIIILIMIVGRIIFLVMNPIESFPSRSYEMAGELTEQSVILQSRLASFKAKKILPDASAYFEISETSDFKDFSMTPDLHGLPENDYVVKVALKNLKPGHRYYYRAIWRGQVIRKTSLGTSQTFQTLPESENRQEVSFVAASCMNYGAFQNLRNLSREEKQSGYPALEAILKMRPDFFSITGDGVYYDRPAGHRARKQPEMRLRWHQQFEQPRMIKLFEEIPTYWQMDDHDFRFDNADNTGEKEPLPALGIQTFLEQVPVLDPGQETKNLYRTYQAGALLQFWLLDGRISRSPNSEPDGPEKSMWGKEQKEWLKKTLLESKAVFKIIISSTAMIGPSRGNAQDDHTQENGFRYEGAEFFKWLTVNHFLEKNLYIISGDNHWKYHSINPTGFEEFATGALDVSNAMHAYASGDPHSSDPNGEIKQPYKDLELKGGFLHVKIRPQNENGIPEATFSHYDEHGNLLYKVVKTAR